MTRLKVLSVASEIYPLIKTGGLADVAGALPKALAAEGVDMRTLIPGYPSVLETLGEAQEVAAFPGLFGTARLLAGKAHGLNLFVLDAPYLFGRPGNPYTGPDGTDWPDNAYRFGALAKIAAELGLGLLPTFVPDVVHMHDWQAGLTAAYMHYSSKAAPAMVMTVHNLVYQGQFPPELVMPLGLPPASFAWDGVEHFGSVGFLKAGLQLADRITTVSPSYAMEIMQAENGMGFEGLLRARAAQVSGILNGIDTEVWDPSKDAALNRTFDAEHLEARTANKAVLRSEMGLSQEPGAMLIGVVSRLSWQKGLDLVLEALPSLIGEGMQLAVLGSGEPELEAKFSAAAEAYPGRIGVKIGYNEGLAHRIQAGADALLVPSRFEPCGLTQLAALRYGAIPVVARVGGLCDTVIDANEMAQIAGVATGVQFSPVTGDSLSIALWRTARLFRNRAGWQGMQKNGMATDVSWGRPANRYASLYLELCRSKSRAGVSTGGRSNVVSIEAAGSGAAKGKAESAGAAGLEGGKEKLAGVETAGLDSTEDKFVTAGSVAFDAAKGKAAGLEAAGSGSANDNAAAVEAADPEPGKDNAVIAGPAGAEGGKSRVVDIGTAGPDRGEGKTAAGGSAEAEAAIGVSAGVEPAGPGGKKDKAAAGEAASPEGGKGEAAGTSKAAPENGKGEAASIGTAVADRGEGKAAGTSEARPENGKSEAASIGTGSQDRGEGKAAATGTVGSDTAKGKGANLEPAGTGSTKDMPESGEAPGSEDWKGKGIGVEPAGSGSGKYEAASIEPGTEESEAEYVMSIACRDE